ncbi:hypothetical protein, partial [Massilia timonae]|uniref:hypothetical protein n=1 Tax=Massilia timonae TaxID=47229 RepID=UPI0028D11C7C
MILIHYSISPTTPRKRNLHPCATTPTPNMRVRVDLLSNSSESLVIRLSYIEGTAAELVYDG